MGTGVPGQQSAKAWIVDPIFADLTNLEAHPLIDGKGLGVILGAGMQPNPADITLPSPAQSTAQQHRPQPAAGIAGQEPAVCDLHNAGLTPIELDEARYSTPDG